MKKYEEARTPYERVMKSKKVNRKTKLMLAQEYYKLNPAELQRNLHIKIESLKKMIRVSKLNHATILN